MGSDCLVVSVLAVGSKFQFTLPHGERLFTRGQLDTPDGFNSRSRMGSDLGTSPCFGLVRVSIHAPAWGATTTRSSLTRGSFVSIHAPAWGATAKAADGQTLTDVSIHAPAWGATSSPRSAWRLEIVSIHAPAWGATTLRLRPGDVGAVSIHAPAWGATPQRRRRAPRRGGFNSRSRMGSDRPPSARRAAPRRFNSRSRMGSDRPPRRAPLASLQFQFTLPHGERLWSQRQQTLSGVSIHAPAWGATRRALADFGVREVSIHAPAWGATVFALKNRIDLEFQFTLPHGERHLAIFCRGELVEFQFTLPHGERLGLWPDGQARPCFNSRSRMGSDWCCWRVAPWLLCFNSRSRMGSDLTQTAEILGALVSIHAPAWGATSSWAPSSGPTSFQFTLPHGERHTREASK